MITAVKFLAGQQLTKSQFEIVSFSGSFSFTSELLKLSFPGDREAKIESYQVLCNNSKVFTEEMSVSLKNRRVLEAGSRVGNSRVLSRSRKTCRHHLNLSVKDQH